METKLTNSEFAFATKLKNAIDKQIDISTYLKIAFHLNISEMTAKRNVSKLLKKSVIELSSVKGRLGNITIKFIVDPYTVFNA